MTDVGIIIAGSLHHAVTSAVIDWGWRQIGKTEFEAPDGRRARYVADQPGAACYGRAAGTPVYLGYLSYTRRDRREFDQMFACGRLVAVYPDRVRRYR